MLYLYYGAVIILMFYDVEVVKEDRMVQNPSKSLVVMARRHSPPHLGSPWWMGLALTGKSLT